MHPAYSIVAFTAASGAGYGLLFLLGILGAAGVLPSQRWFGVTGFVLSFALITAGLLSSMLHLGHPERAWRAITQWRSSWLSREGVMSLVTYGPAILFALGWVVFARTGGIWAFFGVVAAICALLTVYCTGMIYASLGTIPQWNNEWVTPTYLVLALASGALLLNMLAHLFGFEQPMFAWLAIVGVTMGLLLKLGYWRYVDTARTSRTTEAATGLGRIGGVRHLEAPHTQENFVMREMGFHVARRHARKLRLYSGLVGFVLPIVATAMTLAVDGLGADLLALIAVVFAAVGVVIERWLFFAEAKHVVTLFYGASAV